MSRSVGDDIFGSRTQSINQKRKGNTNERVAAKWLEKWTGKKFARVPSSGGLRWANNSSVCGDVVCEDETFDFPFAVETKALKTFALREIMSGRNMIKTLWKQAQRDALRAGKEPLLMLRKNGMPAGEYVVFMSARAADKFYDSSNKSSDYVAMQVKGGLLGYDSNKLLGHYEKFAIELKNE